MTDYRGLLFFSTASDDVYPSLVAVITNNIMCIASESVGPSGSPRLLLIENPAQ